MLDVRRLRHLSELARRGTIAEVARAVGYTPSAVSQSLLQLEREAGVALLERDGRRVRLTPAAHGLVARTERVLAELDAAEAELAAEQQAVRGHVVVGAFPSAATRLVIPATLELARRHPELAVSVREHEPEDGIALLRSGELDLLVSESYENVDPAPVGGLDAQLLLSEPLLLALPSADAADGPGLAGLLPRRRVDRRARRHAVRGRGRAGLPRRGLHAADRAPSRRGVADPGARSVGAGGRLRARTGLLGVRGRALRGGPTGAAARLVHALVRRGAARRPALGALLGALRAAGERQLRLPAAPGPHPP